MPKRFKDLKDKLSAFTDALITIAAIITAIVMMNTVNQQNNSVNKVSFESQPKKTKKVKIPKAELVIDSAYKLTPKRQTLITYDYYGNPHKETKNLAHFYLDPNYASKDEPVKHPIYILLNGQIVPKSKSAKDIDFASGNLAFNKNHFVLDDSYKYIHVMQFLTYSTYGNKIIPNMTVRGVSEVAAKGSDRYLKLSEFKITREDKVNLSQLAQNKQLVCGFKNTLK